MSTRPPEPHFDVLLDGQWQPCYIVEDHNTWVCYRLLADPDRADRIARVEEIRPHIYPELRSFDEIQAAHDRLTALILGEMPIRFSSEEQRKAIVASADVLCWVLRHDHNLTFESNLAMLDEQLRSFGYELHDSGELKVRGQ